MDVTRSGWAKSHKTEGLRGISRSYIRVCAGSPARVLCVLPRCAGVALNVSTTQQMSATFLNSKGRPKVAFPRHGYLGHFTNASAGEGPWSVAIRCSKISKPSECRSKALPLQRITSGEAKRHKVTLKGEGRALELVGGTRNVSVARQNRWRFETVRDGVLQVLVVLFLAALPAFAATHPVPLDKNTDAAKCLECHSDKQQGKAIHSPMATVSVSCH